MITLDGGSPPELRSYVGGTWRSCGVVAEVTNPARPSEIVATACLADATLAAQAVEAAAAWRETSPPTRGEVLRHAAGLLDERAEEIARDLTREEGKTLAESRRETALAADTLRYYAGQTLDPDGETYPSHRPDTLLFTRRR